MPGLGGLTRRTPQMARGPTRVQSKNKDPRSWHELAAAGQRGVSHLLELFASDMRVTMTLIGAKSVHEITRDNLVFVEKEFAAQGPSGIHCRRPSDPRAFCPHV